MLVVDDDLDSVQSMAMLLKEMHHEVEFAINGFAAIDTATRFRPAVILLDIGLPDLRGDRLARILKVQPGLENTRIVAVTGMSDERTRRSAIEAGCDDFYLKPLAPSALEKLLSE